MPQQGLPPSLMNSLASQEQEPAATSAPTQEPTGPGLPPPDPSGSTIEPVPSGWFATLSNSAFFKQFTELTDETRQLLRAVTLPFVMYHETVDPLNPWTRTSPLPQDEIDRIFGRAYIEEHFRRTPGSPTKDGYMDPADPWRSTDPQTGPWSRTIR